MSDRVSFIEGPERETCDMVTLIAFLRDYPNVSNVFVVRRLVAHMAVLESWQRQTPLREAADEISTLIDGDDGWQYPAQLVRAVKAVTEERDQAMARVAVLEKSDEQVLDENSELRARAAELDKLKSQRNLEVCIAKTERDNALARVAELEKERLGTRQRVIDRDQHIASLDDAAVAKCVEVVNLKARVAELTKERDELDELAKDLHLICLNDVPTAAIQLTVAKKRVAELEGHCEGWKSKLEQHERGMPHLWALNLTPKDVPSVFHRRLALEVRARISERDKSKARVAELEKREHWNNRMRRHVVIFAAKLGFQERPKHGLECNSDAAVDWMMDVLLPRVVALEPEMHAITMQLVDVRDKLARLEAETEWTSGHVVTDGHRVGLRFRGTLYVMAEEVEPLSVVANLEEERSLSPGRLDEVINAFREVERFIPSARRFWAAIERLRTDQRGEGGA